ncbi:MAG: hypothetical protein E4H44_01335 [Candidatus Aminicenantes bacterium]|nr:MAG: hypothetical protein E4H44_01335 [Candidatus Aminicenantes bacterium]
MARFRWIGPATMTRSKEGSSGKTLKPGCVYEVSAFSEAVVDEWTATGHAEAVSDDVKDTVLEVHSRTVKSNVPKLGAK